METSAWVEFERTKARQMQNSSQDDIMKNFCPHAFDLKGYYCDMAKQTSICSAPNRPIKSGTLHPDCIDCWTRTPGEKIEKQSFKFTAGISNKKEDK